MDVIKLLKDKFLREDRLEKIEIVCFIIGVSFYIMGAVSLPGIEYSNEELFVFNRDLDGSYNIEYIGKYYYYAIGATFILGWLIPFMLRADDVVTPVVCMSFVETLTFWVFILFDTIFLESAIYLSITILAVIVCYYSFLGEEFIKDKKKMG